MVDDCLCGFVGEGVTAFVGGDFGDQWSADQGEVADEIEEFVVGAFVFVAEGVVDWSGVADDEHVAGGQVCEKSGGVHGVGFVFEAESARGGDVFDVGIRVAVPCDGCFGEWRVWAVVEGVGVGSGGCGFDGD